MAGGKSPKRKGDGFERETCELLGTFGVVAKRLYAAGALAGQHTADLATRILGTDRTLECKRRGPAGFSSIYKWKKNNYGVCVRADGEQSLTIIDTADFATLVKFAEIGWALTRKDEAA